MTEGVCSNCGETDLNTSLIYSCPHCGGEFHDRTWMFIEETLETLEPEDYPAERIVDGCALKVKRVRGVKYVAYQGLPTNGEPADETAINEKETTTMVFQAFQCPHCEKWSTYTNNGLSAIQGTPEDHVQFKQPKTEAVLVEYVARNFQAQLGDY